MTVSGPERCEGRPGVVYVLDLKNADPAEIPCGKVSPAAGRAAYDYVAEAVRMAIALSRTGRKWWAK